MDTCRDSGNPGTCLVLGSVQPDKTLHASKSRSTPHYRSSTHHWHSRADSNVAISRSRGIKPRKTRNSSTTDGQSTTCLPHSARMNRYLTSAAYAQCPTSTSNISPFAFQEVPECSIEHPVSLSRVTEVLKRRLSNSAPRPSFLHLSFPNRVPPKRLFQKIEVTSLSTRATSSLKQPITPRLST